MKLHHILAIIPLLTASTTAFPRAHTELIGYRDHYDPPPTPAPNTTTSTPPRSTTAPGANRVLCKPCVAMMRQCVDERRAAGAVVMEAVFVNCLRKVYYGEGTGRCKKGGRCGELFRVGDVGV